MLTDSVDVLHMRRNGADTTRPPLDAGGPLGDIQRPSPTQEQPVVQLIGEAGSGAAPARGRNGTVENSGTSYYGVGPDVASLQVRLTVDGRTGSRIETIIADGYAWACASDSSLVSKDDPAPGLSSARHVNDRASGAAGNELDINRIR